MPVRKIIRIDEEKCDGCGQCVTACAEGAIQIIDGKARLAGESFCDGLGACLGDCPQGAITIEERDAAQFNEEAVKVHLKHLSQSEPTLQPSIPEGCPGSATRAFIRPTAGPETAMATSMNSQLGHWPVQLMLVPPHAPFLKNADLLICADCVPFAVPDFHQRYLSGRAVVVGCPKLDDLQYYFDKLKELFKQAQPRRVTVLRMEVPCCGGIAQATVQALAAVAPETAVEVHTIGVRGDISCQVLKTHDAA